MSSQFGIEPSTQTPKGVCVVLLNVELLRKLSVYGFDNLSDSIVDLLGIRRALFFLITARNRAQTHAIFAPQLGSLFSGDVTLIAQDI